MWSIVASGRARFIVRIWKYSVIKSDGLVRPVLIREWAGQADKGIILNSDLVLFRPGICYRLYSNAVYANVFQNHTDPEIMQTPLESVILKL